VRAQRRLEAAAQRVPCSAATTIFGQFSMVAMTSFRLAPLGGLPNSRMSGRR